MEWWSIEVLNGRSSAARWKDGHGEALVEAALTNGAVDWAWQEHRWGVVLEVAFHDEWHWERFSALPEPDPTPLHGPAAVAAGSRPAPVGPAEVEPASEG